MRRSFLRWLRQCRKIHTPHCSPVSSTLAAGYRIPYATCPNCGDHFHLNVSVSAIEEWEKKFPKSEHGTRNMECFYCWKELKELDTVQVFKAPDEPHENLEVGDIGAVVHKHENKVFEVECVKENGETKWLHCLPRNVLKYVRESSG